MTIHNGPGIRSLILFKGCPLHCLWCSTPESQKPEPEIAFYPSKCTRCDQCISLCPLNALTLIHDKVTLNRLVCNNCGKCAKVCYPEALKLLGQPMTVEDILSEVKKDAVFYKHSQGGVTISGGEPLLYPNFTERLVQAINNAGISIGVDSCGYVPWENVERVIPFIHFFLWDIKHMDPLKHKNLTGASNEMILRHARSIAERRVPILIRFPVIPGYNDTEANIRATCEFARSLFSIVEVSLLPFHLLGKARYDSLDRTCPVADVPSIPGARLQNMKLLVESYGIKCSIVG
jgi:pyruvate formate lyase activating enzyme